MPLLSPSAATRPAVKVFNINKKGALRRVLLGEKEGTLDSFVIEPCYNPLAKTWAGDDVFGPCSYQISI